MNDDERGGFFEARGVGTIIILQGQLSNEVMPQDRVDRLAGKAAMTFDRVLKESPNDSYMLEISDLIRCYLRNRTDESLSR